MYPFAFSLIFAYLRSVYFFERQVFLFAVFFGIFNVFLGREAAQDEAQDCDGWPNGTCLRRTRGYVRKEAEKRVRV